MTINIIYIGHVRSSRTLLQSYKDCGFTNKYYHDSSRLTGQANLLPALWALVLLPWVLAPKAGQ